jgi:hypothetical protein
MVNEVAQLYTVWRRCEAHQLCLRSKQISCPKNKIQERIDMLPYL